MRRRDDGWEDGRRNWGSGGGWRDGPADGAYDGGYDGYGGYGQANGQAYGQHGHPGYPGPGPQGNPGAGWDGYAAQYPGGGYGHQGNFPARPGAPGEFSPGETGAPAPARSRTPRPYGRLAIFTLMDDGTAEFDRLAEEAAEGVRISEPDTLVYVIHVVPKAPMQRIIYEIYRDRAAFESHENQPHIKRFAEARKSCVLATNIIDLRLKYAKVAALFQGDGRAGDHGGRGGAAALPGHSPQARRALEAGPRRSGEDYPDGQYGGQYEPNGQYHGAPPGPPGRARPPWEDAAGWAPSPYPGQRYGG